MRWTGAASGLLAAAVALLPALLLPSANAQAMAEPPGNQLLLGFWVARASDSPHGRADRYSGGGRHASQGPLAMLWACG